LSKLGCRFAVLLCLVSFPLAALPLPLRHPAPAAPAPGPAPGEKSIYIVQLREAPLVHAPAAAWAAPAEPGGPRKLDLEAPGSRLSLDRIRGRQDEALAAFARTAGREVEPLYRYSVAFNGVAVELTTEEAEALGKLPDVLRVQRGSRLRIASDAGPAWTGAPGIWDGSGTGGLPGTQGEGIVIGVLDTGIALGHASFADLGGDGYNHVNPRGSGNYVGWCSPSNPNYDATLHCNDKLIGVWSWPDSGNNPRDNQGHGTHTASIAAGNHVTANLAAGVSRPISGVAPHANLIAYDVCDNGGYCPSWVLVAGIDQAVADGVDVISLAIADYDNSPWYDSIALALLNARSAGVFVAAALSDGSGIGGPAEAPWALGVAATSHNRRFVTTLAGLAGGSNPPADLTGTALTASYGPAAIVSANQYGSYDCSSPFPARTFHGEIVVCSHYYYDSEVTQGQNVLAGGAGGVILAESYIYGPEAPPVANVLPAIRLTPADSNTLYNWLSSGSGHAGRITATAAVLDSTIADRLWVDSPEGPGYYRINILKPDVAAPGREILAAHINPGGYSILSGTSMAAAHAAGAAALLTALHPGWTPAQIQSALQTTAASVTHDDGTPAVAYEVGGGRLDLSAAARAGLVLDETAQNFQAANPNSGGDPKTLNLAGLADDYCLLTCSWTRTVQSTLAVPTQWTVSVVMPPGVGATVTPSSFTLNPGASQQLQITVTGNTSLAGYTYERVVLTPAGGQAPVAHLPIATYWVPHYPLTVQKKGTGSGRVTSSPAGIDCGSDCSEPFPDSSAVTLTATPDPGSVFVGWGDWGAYCDPGSTTCTVRMYSSQTVTAYFNPPSPDKALGNQTALKDSINGPVREGTWNYYYADVPAGTGQLIVDVIDMDGVADLLVRNGAKPDFGNYDCEDYSYYYRTPNRRCVIIQPAAGRWWIGVVNEDEGVAIHYSIRASWGATNDRQLANHAPVNDFVSSPSPGGGWKYYFFDLPADSSDLSVALSSLSADADLYLRLGAKPDRSNFDCTSANASTLPELCSVAHPAAGRWWIGVNNFSAGTVTYNLLANWNETVAPVDFYSLAPCRLFDSRTAQPLVSGTALNLQATGLCQIPAGARALSVNVTVVGPTGPGYLVLYPGNEAQPLSSTVNFQSGQVRANNAILKLDPTGALQALAIVQGSGQTHVVVDVNGYYQ
jgi:subtilisin family serine protease